MSVLTSISYAETPEVSETVEAIETVEATEKQEISKLEKDKMLLSLTENLTKHGVVSCLNPLVSIFNGFLNNEKISYASFNTNLIESKRLEPVVLNDYNIILNNNVNYDSVTYSLQATPYTEQSACLIIQTLDYLMLEKDNCESIIKENQLNETLTFNIDYETNNQFGKKIFFASSGAQKLTFNNVKDKGCHVRDVNYLQYQNNNK